MIHKGSYKNFVVEKGSWIDVKASGSFIVYGLQDGVRQNIYGPGNLNQWSLKFRSLHDELDIICLKDVNLDICVKCPEDFKEKPDPTPMFLELPTKALSVEQQVKELVRAEALRNQVDKAIPTFEEENDFDIDDEGVMLSGHEYNPMDNFEDIDDDQDSRSNELPDAEIPESHADQTDSSQDDKEKTSQVVDKE